MKFFFFSILVLVGLTIAPSATGMPRRFPELRPRVMHHPVKVLSGEQKPVIVGVVYITGLMAGQRKMRHYSGGGLHVGYVLPCICQTIQDT